MAMCLECDKAFFNGTGTCPYCKGTNTIRLKPFKLDTHNYRFVCYGCGHKQDDKPKDGACPICPGKMSSNS